MELKIYDKQGLVKMTVSPDNSSQWNHEVGVENVVTVNFTTWEFLVLEVGWYILVEGQRFSIKSEYRPKHIHDTKYTYNLKFYGREHDAQDILFCRLNQGEDDLESVFAYDGTPMDFLQKVVANMNRNTDGVEWKAGEAITANRQTINFNGLYCWDALGEIARAFGTEWWMDGEYLNISKCERGESVSLGYGQGLKSGLTQNENTNAVKWFTRLIPVGSSKNIDKSKYGYATLQLPGREKYIDINTQYGLKEYREEAAFSEIYPHRVGTISSVRSEERTNEETGNYTVYYVKDSSLPFNPDEYMIGGEVIHMTFNNGALAGKDFEVNWNNETKEFEIINQYPDENTQLPGGNLVPSVDDTYVLWNISMPDEYIRAAEQELKTAVDVYLAEYSKDISVYSGSTDYIYISKNNVPLSLGQRVRLLSEVYFGNIGRDSRITRVSRKLNNLNEATIDCSDAIASSWKSSVDSSLNQLQFSVAKELAQTVIEILKTSDIGNPSDYNVLSSLRSLNTFLRKDKDDRSKGVIASDKGFEVGKFESGTLGTGASMYEGEDKNTYVEADFLKIRKKATFTTISVQELKHVGGEIILSPAAIICSRVEETENGWKCYFNTEDSEGRKVYQEFEVDDLARCQTFNLSPKGANDLVGNHYYWRKVISVGEDYIELSEFECDAQSDAPQVGDNICQLGNIYNKERQNAIVLSAYGEDAPSYKQYKGINDFVLTNEMIVTKFSPKGNEITGILNIEKGSHGANNLEDFPDEVFKAVHVGSVNLLKNTGFTGNYRAEDLSNSPSLSSDSELYSKKLNHWTGEATVNEDSEAISGYSVTIGNLSQALELIKDESYVVSFKAKGTNVSVIVGRYSIEQELTPTWDKYYFKLTSDGIGTFTLSGEATICDIKLERGTIATDWSASPYDNDKALDEFKAINYLSDAINNGSTDILGGLILSSMMQLGNYKDSKMVKVNAGVSGIYNNDDDVAFWGGGNFEQAIRTISRFKENPNYKPTDKEWADMANFVVSHGGDVFLRGYINALGGIFRGAVEIANGKILLNDDGSGHFANEAVRWTKEGIMFRKGSDNIVWKKIDDFYDTVYFNDGTFFDITTVLNTEYILSIPNYETLTIALKQNALSRSSDSATLIGVFIVYSNSDGLYTEKIYSYLKVGVRGKIFELIYDKRRNAWRYNGDDYSIINVEDNNGNVIKEIVSLGTKEEPTSNGITSTITYEDKYLQTHTMKFENGILISHETVTL